MFYFTYEAHVKRVLAINLSFLDEMFCRFEMEGNQRFIVFFVSLLLFFVQFNMYSS